MPKSRSRTRVLKVPIARLVDHPDNPNRMSKGNFARLVRNIERTGRYEPLIVRPCPATNCHSCPASECRVNSSRNPDTNGKRRRGCFQIINGRHRQQALRELGHETVDVIVWDIDDEQTDILLATLNRLGGSNVLEKKLALLSRLNERMKARDMAKLLPHSAGQIQRLVQVHSGATVCTQSVNSVPDRSSGPAFANPQVFLLSDAQQKIVEAALSLARCGGSEKTKAARNAAALVHIAHNFVQNKKEM